MIKLEKRSIYYLKNEYHHETTTEKRTFYDMPQALKAFEESTPRYYINKKDFSIIEEINLYYKSDFGIKCYYKRIDPTNEKIETNYIKER